MMCWRGAKSRCPKPRRRATAALIERLEGRAFFSADALAVGASGAEAALVVDAVARPRVTAVRPGANAVDVPRDTQVAVDLFLPSGGLEAASVNAATVRLRRVIDNAPVLASSINTSGGGDAIVFQPADRLEPNAEYAFAINSGARDLTGNPIEPFESRFTTGAGPGAPDGPVRFDKIVQGASQWRHYTSVVKGPDGRLYAGTLEGEVLRFPILPDGSLDAPTIIDTLARSTGGNRYLVGMKFDPRSTADNPILWITHGPYASIGAPDWSSTIGRLSGPDLGLYYDAVVGLPRSYRDHLTNQPTFGPDGALYVAQASNTAMGAPDKTWGDRPEHVLSGAILRVDTAALDARLAAGEGPLNVQTSDGGTYDPYAPGSPVTLYATGVRNAYDLVWHSNGTLYAPVNGSAAGGNTPAAPDRPQTGINNLQQTDDDHLLAIDRGGFYGHPNPTRGEYVLDGGNPTDAPDPQQIDAYPVGTQPEPNWRPAAYNFGANYSPDGITEYKSDTFGGALKGALLVARYSGGDDIIVLRPDATGALVAQTGTPGMTGFTDPIDIAEDRPTGNLYVAEFGGQRITLLRPTDGPGGNVGGPPAPPPPSGPPTVASVDLIDADTGVAIGALIDGATLDLANLPTRRLNVRAEAGGAAQSVRFGLDDVLNYRTESHAPYSLAGDAAGPAGTLYSVWTPTIGAHMLKVYAFDGLFGTGNRSGVYAAQFNVIDSSIVPPTPVPEPIPEPAPIPDPIPAPAKPQKPGKPQKPPKVGFNPPDASFGPSWVPFLGPFRAPTA